MAKAHFLLKCRDNATYESYKATKREAGKVIQEAKCKANDNLYNKLGTKEGYNNIYKFCKTREMKKGDLNGVQGIKDEGQRVSIKEQDIKQRWKIYFDKHFNGNGINDWSDLGSPTEDRSRRFFSKNHDH